MLLLRLNRYIELVPSLMHVREGFNLRLPLRDSRDNGLADPMPMDTSATLLFGGSKGHSIFFDVGRTACTTFLTILPRFLQGCACTCNELTTPVVLKTQPSAPLLLLVQNNSPAKQVSTPQSDVNVLRECPLSDLRNKKNPAATDSTDSLIR
jgi:hypothetical protein